MPRKPSGLAAYHAAIWDALEAKAPGAAGTPEGQALMIASYYATLRCLGQDVPGVRAWLASHRIRFHGRDILIGPL